MGTFHSSRGALVAILLSSGLLHACDRWQGVTPTVTVSAAVVDRYSSGKPGMVVVEHDGYWEAFAVGTLCGSAGEEVAVTAHYLLAGCAEPHAVRASTVPLLPGFTCEQDLQADPVFVPPDDLEVADVNGDWVTMYGDHNREDGCFADDGAGEIELLVR